MIIKELYENGMLTLIVQDPDFEKFETYNGLQLDEIRYSVRNKDKIYRLTYKQ